MERLRKAYVVALNLCMGLSLAYTIHHGFTGDKYPLIIAWIGGFGLSLYQTLREDDE